MITKQQITSLDAGSAPLTLAARKAYYTDTESPGPKVQSTIRSSRPPMIKPPKRSSETKIIEEQSSGVGHDFQVPAPRILKDVDMFSPNVVPSYRPRTEGAHLINRKPEKEGATPGTGKQNNSSANELSLTRMKGPEVKVVKKATSDPCSIPVVTPTKADNKPLEKKKSQKKKPEPKLNKVYLGTPQAAASRLPLFGMEMQKHINQGHELSAEKTKQVVDIGIEPSIRNAPTKTAFERNLQSKLDAHQQAYHKGPKGGIPSESSSSASKQSSSKRKNSSKTGDKVSEPKVPKKKQDISSQPPEMVALPLIEELSNESGLSLPSVNLSSEEEPFIGFVVGPNPKVGGCLEISQQAPKNKKQVAAKNKKVPKKPPKPKDPSTQRKRRKKEIDGLLDSPLLGIATEGQVETVGRPIRKCRRASDRILESEASLKDGPVVNSHADAASSQPPETFSNAPSAENGLPEFSDDFEPFVAMEKKKEETPDKIQVNLHAMQEVEIQMECQRSPIEDLEMIDQIIEEAAKSNNSTPIHENSSGDITGSCEFGEEDSTTCDPFEDYVQQDIHADEFNDTSQREFVSNNQAEEKQMVQDLAVVPSHQEIFENVFTKAADNLPEEIVQKMAATNFDQETEVLERPERIDTVPTSDIMDVELKKFIVQKEFDSEPATYLYNTLTHEVKPLEGITLGQTVIFTTDQSVGEDNSALKEAISQCKKPDDENPYLASYVTKPPPFLPDNFLQPQTTTVECSQISSQPSQMTGLDSASTAFRKENTEADVAPGSLNASNKQIYTEKANELAPEKDCGTNYSPEINEQAEQNSSLNASLLSKPKLKKNKILVKRLMHLPKADDVAKKTQDFVNCQSSEEISQAVANVQHEPLEQLLTSKSLSDVESSSSQNSSTREFLSGAMEYDEKGVLKTQLVEGNTTNDANLPYSQANVALSVTEDKMQRLKTELSSLGVRTESVDTSEKQQEESAVEEQSYIPTSERPEDLEPEQLVPKQDSPQQSPYDSSTMAEENMDVENSAAASTEENAPTSVPTPNILPGAVKVPMATEKDVIGETSAGESSIRSSKVSSVSNLPSEKLVPAQDAKSLDSVATEKCPGENVPSALRALKRSSSSKISNLDISDSEEDEDTKSSSEEDSNDESPTNRPCKKKKKEPNDEMAVLMAKYLKVVERELEKIKARNKRYKKKMFGLKIEFGNQGKTLEQFRKAIDAVIENTITNPVLAPAVEVSFVPGAEAIIEESKRRVASKLRND